MTNPTDEEIREAAMLYGWLLQHRGRRVPAWVQIREYPPAPLPAKVIGNLRRDMQALGGVIPGDRESLSYGNQLRWAQLEAWWEHQKVLLTTENDRALRRQLALAKLTADDCEVLGLSV